MSEMEPWTRQLLSVIVSQLCKTIGWHSISTTCLQVLVDVLHRYLKQLGTNIHDYTDHYNHTFPALEELQLAFLDMGVNIEDLKEYADYVTPITIKTKVPKYPLEKKSNMNFLKPGSREVVTRPVHIHEHLPAMHPELSEDNYSSQETAVENSVLSSLPDIGSTTYKKSSDSVDALNNKRITRLIAEETGRPVRELSCVMMTTSGFLSPAREGKLPEARLPKMFNHTPNFSKEPSSCPTVPSDVKGDHHKKANHAKSSSKPAERNIREEHQNGREDGDDSKIKKLASMKELSKLKAFKSISKPVDGVDSAKVIRQEKLKFCDPVIPKEPKMPKPAKEKHVEKIPEPAVVNKKLTTESNNQKLKIFKRISKVKEDRAESPVPKGGADRHSPKVVFEKTASINDSIEAVVKRSRDKDELLKNRDKEKPPEPHLFVEESAVQETKLPPPPAKHIKRKKKQKHDAVASKKMKLSIEVTTGEIEKPKATEPEPPPFSFFTQLQATPGLMPPALKTNLLIPRFPNPFMNMTKLNPNCPHPEMPNLPLPPPMLMQPTVDVRQKSPIKSQEPDVLVDNNAVSIADKKLKKKMKKDKREKDKKKRDKKEKLKNKNKLLKNEDKVSKSKDKPLKNKDKVQKKKEKGLKKIKLRNKDKPKKKEKLSLQKETVAEDASVPKLKLKLGSANSPQLSPSGIQSPKIVIKPIVKHDDVPSSSEITVVKEREPSPELAKISALTCKPAKQKGQKVLAEPTVVVAKPVVEPTTITISTKGKRGSTSLEIKPKSKEKQKSKKEEAKQKPAPFYYDALGNQVWVCPTCGTQDDGSPMIGCDGCDAWYHWVCVGIRSPPESAKWFCGSCAV